MRNRVTKKEKLIVETNEIENQRTKVEKAK